MGSRIFIFITAFSLILKIPPVYGQGGEQEPISLMEEITVELFMELSGTQSVRLIRDPLTGDIFYTAFGGEVYRILQDNSGIPEDTLLYTAEDHGITRLQGAAFLDSSLFLSGNILVNNDKGTKGLMMRGDLQPSGERTWTRVFISEEIGTVKTVFDHGFNGVAISPDKQYIFVNSGARTDHGEVQDNDGEYPNSRDEPLTACIFRIPTDTENLLLRNDHKWLVEEGYLFAEGIRNAYDIEFAPNGHLFAVSNSGDYDHPEDMFWIREGHHYGFPWVMGEVENPQQYEDFQPDHTEDPFMNPFSHAYRVKYFHNDPDFPKKPEGVSFTPPVQNLGPDTNFYRDKKTGKVADADTTGVTVGTFTPHSSPLGLFFDKDSILAGDLKGDGFMLNFNSGRRSALMRPFGPQGEDLVHLDLIYDPEADNYNVRITRLVDQFNGPTDALMIGNKAYVIEYGGRRRPGRIWKVTLPRDRGMASGN